MSDLPPTPPSPEPGDSGQLRFRPLVTVVLVTLIAGVVVLLAFAAVPAVLWVLAALPLVAGALHAAGRSEEKTRRFFKAFLITIGVQVAVAVIVYGVCLAIVQSQTGG